MNLSLGHLLQCVRRSRSKAIILGGDNQDGTIAVGLERISTRHALVVQAGREEDEVHDLWVLRAELSAQVGADARTHAADVLDTFAA